MADLQAPSAEWDAWRQRALSEATGANFSNYEDTIKNTVLDMARNGVTVVSYTGSGKVIRTPTDVAVRRAIRTEATQAMNKSTVDNLDKLGYDLVEVSACKNPRASHEVWQGQVYSLSGNSDKYRNFEQACEVGDPVNGIGGYNCDHRVSIHIEGRELRPSSQDPLEGTGYTYEQARDAVSKQRAMENTIRKLKREQAVGKALGLDTPIANKKVKAYTAALKQHVADNAAILHYDTRRINVYSVSMAREGLVPSLDAAGRARIMRTLVKNTNERAVLGIRIDKFTACLEDAQGNVLPTRSVRLSADELKPYKKSTGWFINWSTEAKTHEVYGLTLVNDDTVQGLISLRDDPENASVELGWVVAAKSNRGVGRKYYGVGGHMFAIAAKRSEELGYNGFMYGMAKNQKLAEHYVKELGAKRYGYLNISIDEQAARELLNKYTFEE